MILLKLFISFVILTALGLGISVYVVNRKRRVNQAFIFACVCMCLWLASNLAIIFSTEPDYVHSALTYAYAISVCIPTAFHFLRLAIKFPDENWQALLARARIQVIANLLVCISCFFPTFIESVSFPVLENGTVGLALAKYGAPYAIFNAYFILSIIIFASFLYRDRHSLRGAQRTEFEFLGFACFAGLVVGLLCGTIFASVIQTSAPVPIAHAASVLTLVIIVAYGISVHRILAVAVILRTITAYSLLSAYLIFVYLISWLGIGHALERMSVEHELPAHIAATLAVVFSMAPVHGRFQKVADKLVNTQTMDVPATLKKAGEICQSVTTIDALLHQFSELLLNALGADESRILLTDGNMFIQKLPSDSQQPASISKASSLVKMILKAAEPISHDALVRFRQNAEITNAISDLDKLNMNIVTGVFSKETLNGLVFFGHRKGGRSYDKTEQEALQILCNQFAVALENAQLYTEMQDSKIRNEIMLDQLVSGVIVASPERKITLFNHEAQRITGIPDIEAIGMEIENLPKPIYQALDTTLTRKSGIRNVDASLYSPEEQEESSSIRMGSAFLFGHDEKPMGALLVFTDITELKGLEEQVRRTDQLSSVGTLAAGMAHEIKNPLVTIKTFTQLLPQRYADEDFRNDFSSLVAHEVSRIDGIVNELLSFSKPAKPHLVPMNLQETVDQTLKLIHEQLAQKNIALNNKCSAPLSLILGDAKLLSQALVNLNLNAIEAIKDGGTITVGTINCSYRFANADTPEKATTRKCVRLQITDTGHGIEQDDLQKIFDPFFTSKSEGTGMGLSVAHGIISEHHGVIEVESERGRGTTFYVYIPLLEEAASA